MDSASGSAREQAKGPSPIHRIPLEILLLIFSLVLDDNNRDAWVLKGIQSLAVSHVCRLWRRATLNYTELWTTIPMSSNGRNTKEFLKRSSPAPIRVYSPDTAFVGSESWSWSSVSHTDQVLKASLLPILREMSRIQELEISSRDIPVDSLTTVCETWVEFPAPLLQRLSLIGFDVLDHHELPGRIPASLQSLTLAHCEIYAPPVALQNVTLTSLVVNACLITDDDLLQVLCLVPSLKTFTSVTNHFSDEWSLEDERINVKLMQLEKLSITGYCQYILGLLGHLSFPCDAELELFYGTAGGPWVEFEHDIKSMFRDRFSRQLATGLFFQTLDILELSTRVNRLALSNPTALSPAMPLNMGPVALPPRVAFSLVFHPQSRNVEKNGLALLRCVPIVEKTRFLNFEIEVEFSPETWMEFSNQMPFIERITIRRRTLIHSLFAMLADRTSPVFPHLNLVILEGVHFTEPTVPARNSLASLCDSGLAADLIVTAVNHRAASGVPLRLRIHECKISRVIIAGMKSLLGDNVEGF